MVELGLTLLVILSLLIYKLYRKNSNYFAEKNVESTKPFPFLGFMYEVIFKQRHINDVFGEYYKQFHDSRFEFANISFNQSRFDVVDGFVNVITDSLESSNSWSRFT